MPVVWIIEKMDVYPEYEGKQNVVNRIYWLAEQSQNGVTVDSRGIETLDYVAGDPFIPFDSLTEATAINWVKSRLGAVNIKWVEDSLAANLQEKLTPPTPVESPALPWG